MRRFKSRPAFALLVSLWLLVAISAVSLSVSLRSRQERLLAANRVESSRAEAVADGALERVHAQVQTLLSEESQDRARDAWLRLPDRDTIHLNGVSCVIAVRDLGARLNLNSATEDEFRRLLRALRIDAGEADRIAQAVSDWKDPDDFPRARGAERDRYLKEGAAALPANRPFSAVSELRLVFGVRNDQLERMSDVLTIDGTGRINLNTAPREVLLVLPGMGDEAVQVIMRLRSARGSVTSVQDIANQLSTGAQEALRAAMPALDGRTTTETQELEAVATAWIPGSPVRVVVSGLFVRGGGTAFFVQRRVEP